MDRHQWYQQIGGKKNDAVKACLSGWYMSPKIAPSLFRVWNWVSKRQLKYIYVKCCESG